MNRKAWIIVVLLVHLIVHPMTHAFAASPAQHGTTVADRSDASSSTDECGLCRIASALTLLALLAMVATPRASFRRRTWFTPVARPFDLLSEVPSRAPPLFA